MLFFNGSYGLVAILDPATDKKARELAQEWHPTPSGDLAPLDFKTEAPHVTLFHARLVNVPDEEVLRLLQSIHPLVGASVHLGPVEPYGDRFLFWDTVKSPTLQAAHSAALGLAAFLDPTARSRAADEQLTMSAVERKNVERYGHPLVGPLYRPHVTIGYRVSGFAKGPLGHIRHTGSVERIVFAEMGEYGSVKNIIHSSTP